MIRRLLAPLVLLIACRRHRHHFNTLCEPPACIHCGRSGWAA